MRSPFSPAIALMNRLSFQRKCPVIDSLFAWFQRQKVSHKLMLISVFFLIPDSVLLCLFLSSINENIHFAQWEKYGNEYQRPLEELLDQLPQHYLHARRVVAGDKQSAELLADTEARIESAFDALEAADARLGSKLQFTDDGLAKRNREHCHMQNVKEAWQNLKGQLRDVELKDSADQHLHLIAQVRTMITHAGDTSNLILDPDLDSYYLMDVTLLALPQMQDRLATVMAFGETALRQGTMTDKDRNQLSVYAALLKESDLDRVVGSTHTALNEDQNFYGTSESLQRTLPSALVEFTRTSESFIELTRRLAEGGNSRIDPEEFVATGARARQASFDLWRIADDELDVLLQTRMGHFKSRRAKSLILTALALLAAVSFVSFITRSISGPLQKQAAALRESNEALGAEVIERRRAEEAMRVAEERTRLIVETALDAVVTMDANGSITGWNSQAETTFGWSQSEVAGRTLADVIVAPEFRVAHSQELQRLLDAKEATALNRRIEVTALHRDGHEFVVELTVCLARVRNTHVYSAFLRDITDRKRSEAERQQAREAAESANRAKSDFLANMSHEIRTPMNGILGMTELALDTELTREQREYLELVKYSANSLLTVINDILDFSKIEAGKLLLDPVPFNLADCVADTMKTLGVRAQQKGLELIQHVHPEVPVSVVGDMSRVRQVLVNLVGNALKFTEQGEVLVRVQPESRTDEEVVLHFSVADTGIGIPPEKVKSIFNAFEQADGSITRKYGGTGLGLSISSQLIALMGGRIWVESEAGRGSTFHFTVRFGIHHGSLAENERTSLASLRDLPVLIVDDNATNRRILELVTTNWHMHPTLAESGPQALRLLDVALERDEPFGLVLLDAQMPGMDGFTLAENIKRRVEMSKVTIMMLSSAGQLGDAQRCRELGLAAYLTKPVKQSELLDAIMLTMNPVVSDAEPVPGLATTTKMSPACEVHGWRILLAEDNLVNQRVAVRTLEKMGHSVDVVPNGREAIAALERQRFDLVVMDVQMPVMDGLEATRAIRQSEQMTGGHLPIIAMTAHAMTGNREQCLDAGMDAYASKPIQPKELGETITQVMARFGGGEATVSALSADTSSIKPTRRDADAEVPAVDRESLDIVDMKALLERLGGDPDLLIEIVGIYLEDGPRLLDDMRQAIARRDGQSLANAAHQYKGTALNLSAEPAAGVAAQLEQIGRSSNLNGVEEVLEHMEQEAAALTSALVRLEPTGVAR